MVLPLRRKGPRVRRALKASKSSSALSVKSSWTGSEAESMASMPTWTEGICPEVQLIAAILEILCRIAPILLWRLV